MKQLSFRCIVVAVAALFCACTGANHAFAQATNTGTVVGEIADSSGALIPGAAVTLTNASTGLTLTDTTNAAGKYAFTTVPPGTYSISATKSGFSTARTSGQVVNLGEQLTVNLTLKVGTSTETVEVQVVGTELQTLNSTVSQTIGQEAIDSLPSLNHDVNTFTVLQPGVSVEGSVAGAVNDQSTFLLDGGNATNDMDGGNNVYMGTFAGDPTEGEAGAKTGVSVPTGALPTPTDSVQEVTVNSANQTRTSTTQPVRKWSLSRRAAPTTGMAARMSTTWTAAWGRTAGRTIRPTRRSPITITTALA